MQNEFHQLLIKVAKKVAKAKVELAVMADKYPVEYMQLRYNLNQIVDEMAQFCKCPPSHLVFGKIQK